MGVFVPLKFEIYLQNKQISYLQFYSYALTFCTIIQLSIYLCTKKKPIGVLFESSIFLQSMITCRSI